MVALGTEVSEVIQRTCNVKSFWFRIREEDIIFRNTIKLGKEVCHGSGKGW